MPLPGKIKNKLLFLYKSYSEKSQINVGNTNVEINEDYSNDYVRQIVNIPEIKEKGFVGYKENTKCDGAVKYIAYYLTQFHPNKKNDEWWGKGTTEWTNVSKTVPQYTNHYQPRLPGELGYYDLRLKEAFEGQISLAKNYGIDAFCYYYYWFDGERLLERPLDLFLENKDLDINFCISWANENWTRRFSGTNTDILMKIGQNEESDIRFIYSVIDVFKDERYLRINNKPVLIVYRPMNLHNSYNVIKEWRRIVKERVGVDMYIIATQEKADKTDWTKKGFDAETEFMPKTVLPYVEEITERVNTIRKDFKGNIYDYKDIVNNRRYVIKNNLNRKVYPAIMPMWDNTARRNQNAVIFDGATPELYGKWLDDLNERVLNNSLLDEKLIFINAWNEWGEGAYLEPDRYWGYAYLQETYNSNRRINNNEKQAN